jgi:DNA repair photolyase
MEIVRKGSQLFVNEFPVLGFPDEDRAVKYFSLNPFLPDKRNRCPLECAYCVCHQDRQWHHHPEQYADALPPDDLLEALLDHIFATAEGQQGFPISLCDYSDPFIPAHQERVISILEALIERDASNMVYITTKAHPGSRYLAWLAAALARPNALRVTVFVSLPPLKRGYEPVSIPRRVQRLKDLTALQIPCSWYLRPLVEEWYDEELMWKLSRELLPHVANHVILSGIVMSEEVEAELLQKRLYVPDWDRSQPGKKQNLRPEFEAKLRGILQAVAKEAGITMGPVMGHRLCGTNGNHAYGCLLCGKQARYCQLFQLHHYGATVDAADNQQLKILLREKAAVVRARGQSLPILPTTDECRPISDEVMS